MMLAFETYTGDILEAYTKETGVGLSRAKADCRDNLVTIYNGFLRTAPTDQIVESIKKQTTR